MRAPVISLSHHRDEAHWYATTMMLVPTVLVRAPPLARRSGGHALGRNCRCVAYGQTFFGFLPIENVFGSAETNS